MSREEALTRIMKYASMLSDENVNKILSLTEWHFVRDPEALNSWEEE